MVHSRTSWLTKKDLGADLSVSVPLITTPQQKISQMS